MDDIIYLLCVNEILDSLYDKVRVPLIRGKVYKALSKRISFPAESVKGKQGYYWRLDRFKQLNKVEAVIAMKNGPIEVLP
jgi:hypothetical protein